MSTSNDSASASTSASAADRGQKKGLMIGLGVGAVAVAVAVGAMLTLGGGDDAESHPNAAELAAQGVCFAQVPPLFYDDRGNCYSQDPTLLTDAGRAAALVIPGVVTGPTVTIAGSSGPAAPRPPAASTPASGPVAPGASTATGSTTTTAAGAPSAPTGDVTIDNGSTHEWILRLVTNPPSGLDQPISLSFAISGGTVSNGIGFDPNTQFESSTIGNVTANEPFFLMVTFTQGGITRSGLTLEGTLDLSGGSPVISGTYHYTNAENTSITADGDFTLTMN